MSNSNLSDEQIALLNQPLDPKRFKTRAGGGGSTLTYLAGFDIIETANRIFNFGGWGFDIISNELQTVLDENGAIVGSYYAARVKVQVYGCLPITEEGVCTVQAARNPRALVDAHDMARKGAITDAMKRAFRCFGNQFGNPLYDKDFASSDNIDHSNSKPPSQPTRAATTQPAPRPTNQPAPAQTAPRAVTPTITPNPASNPNVAHIGNGEKATDAQIQAILRMTGRIGLDEIALANRLNELYGCPLLELNKSDAGHYIQLLQQKA
jgi:DNA repair and recombination protein RAD52